MADDQYQTDLERSGRNKRTAAAMAALVALGIASYGDGSAEDALGTTIDAIGPAARDVLAQLAADIQERFGSSPLDVDSVWAQFLGNVQTYLSQAASLPPDQRAARLRLILQDQLHAAEAALTEQAAEASATYYVRRQTHPERTISGPCPVCKDLEGVHPSDDPDLYWTHPNCQCTWEPMGADAGSSPVQGFWEAFAESSIVRVFNGRGNEPVLLRYWRNRMAGGHPGDYYECISALEPHAAKIGDPHALCAWLHKQSTGYWPGHAPSEQKAK